MGFVLKGAFISLQTELLYIAVYKSVAIKQQWGDSCRIRLVKPRITGGYKITSHKSGIEIRSSNTFPEAWLSSSGFFHFFFNMTSSLTTDIVTYGCKFLIQRYEYFGNCSTKKNMIAPPQCHSSAKQ